MKKMPSEKCSKDVGECGDGVSPGELKSCKKPSRTAVPSWHKLATRPPPRTPGGDGASTKEKIQRAVRELATNPNITHRKSLTLAEFTPTRKSNMKK